MARTIAKDYEQKREAIRATAANVFATEGFDRASMTLLAARCGISKASIYHYFDSKEALLFDILNAHLTALRDRVLGLTDQGEGAESFVRAVITEILLAYQGADDEHRVLTNLTGALSPEQKTVLSGLQRELIQFVSTAIAAQSPGLAKTPKKLHETTMALFGMLNWYYMWNRSSETQARLDYARLVADLFLNGVGGPCE